MKNENTEQEALTQAMEDWNSKNAYIDGRGNYRLRVNGTKRRAIAPWNKIVKRRFADVDHFHNAAQTHLARPTQLLRELESNANDLKAVRALKRLASKWPKDLWLFTNGHGLYVMRKKNGKRVVTPSGGMDPDYVIAAVKIESDGGDW